ncbi:MAG: cytochrome c family protein [Parvularculaceae bacterium]|nr:cytochrome c family protein [Parvularculaceae bacterium]
MQDPMFFNKIAAALLVALLLFFGLPQLATALRGGHHGGGHEAEGAHPFPQYPIEYAAEGGSGGEAAAPVDFATVLAGADPKAGERRAALCKSCHTLDKGGANGTGPNLWGVVGRAVASHEGFNYTGALKAAGGDWTFDRLSAYLENSQAYIPGTAMVQRFPKVEQRAELIAYLNTLSDSPMALPTPAPAAEPAVEPAAEDATAEEATTEEQPAEH